MRIGINLKIAAESFFTAELAIKRMNEYSYVVFVSKFAFLLFATENIKKKTKKKTGQNINYDQKGLNARHFISIKAFLF